MIDCVVGRLVCLVIGYTWLPVVDDWRHESFVSGCIFGLMVWRLAVLWEGLVIGCAFGKKVW